jgi:hypothetical protein
LDPYCSSRLLDSGQGDLSTFKGLDKYQEGLRQAILCMMVVRSALPGVGSLELLMQAGVLRGVAAQINLRTDSLNE